MSLTRRKRHQRWPSHKNRSKTAFLRAKLAARPMGLGARYSSIDSTRSAFRRLSKGKANKDGEAAAINYLHNAQGQRVFKGEPRVLNYQRIPARRFAIHSDHLGTPRLVTNEQNTPVWQWPYSAFGDNKPTGILKATANPKSAVTNSPHLLKATSPAAEFDLRFPGQYADDEAGVFYNYFRNYRPNQGRYDQGDPIGLAGGINRFGYVEGNPISYTDPLGLLKLPNDPSGLPSDWTRDPFHRDPNGDRFRDPNGSMLDWHKGRPGLPGWRGKDHWHHNGGDEHLPPGTDVPDSCPTAPSIFDRLKNYLTPLPVYDPRRDRLMPVPPIFLRVIPLPIP